MTFTKANNSYGINCYQSCWELPGKVIVARWETGAAVVGGKLNDLHASATTPFMSLIQVQAYPFSPSHQTRTRPSVSPHFTLFRFPWANKYVNTCYFKWHTLCGAELEVQISVTDANSNMSYWHFKSARRESRAKQSMCSVSRNSFFTPTSLFELSRSFHPAEVCLCCKTCG